MLKSFKLKLYANKGKLEKIDNLLFFWQQEVQRWIDVCWDLQEVKGSYPPKDKRGKSRFEYDASLKAWQIVKGVKGMEQGEKPTYKGDEVDLNTYSVVFKDFTNHFDFWFRLSTLEKYKRVNVPCKKYRYFSKALKQGTLKNSAKLLKRGKYDYYLQVYIDIPEVEPKAAKYLGIDQGLNKPVTTSNGTFYGEDLVVLRRKTKWRKYNKGLSGYKQGLNKVAKELVQDYPDYNFALEDLLFKGKHKRTRKFRRNNNNWAYNHLGRRLASLGALEGFQVFKVEAKNTSTTCPSCDYMSKGNRNGSTFKCQECGYTNHTDIVGAINILERVPKDFACL